MIERQIINGRPASVAYVTSDFEPATKDDFDYARVLFDDGEAMLLKSPDEGSQEASSFTRHRDRHQAPVHDTSRLEAREETAGYARQRTKQAEPIQADDIPLLMGRTYEDWAIFIAADDFSRIDNALRTGLITGLSAAEIARNVIGTQSLNGLDGVTAMTRQRIAHLGQASIRRKKP